MIIKTALLGPRIAIALFAVALVVAAWPVLWWLDQERR
jgi:hypothetical protein